MDLRHWHPERCEQINKLNDIFTQRGETGQTQALKTIGSVVDILPESFFKMAEWCRKLGGANLLSRRGGITWSHGNKLSVPYYQAWCTQLATWFCDIARDTRNTCDTRGTCNAYATLCNRATSSYQWCNFPVFVEKIPFDSPFIFDNLLIPIEDKPLYEVALACARQYCRRELSQEELSLFLERSDVPLRSALVLNLEELKNNKLSFEFKFAKQISRSQLVRDLHDDIETLATGYIRLVWFLAGGYVAKNEWGITEDDYRALGNVPPGEGSDGSEGSVRFYPAAFNVVFKSEARNLKTVELLKKHNFLLETLVGQISREVGDSLLRCKGDYKTSTSLYFKPRDIGEFRTIVQEAQ
jgi:hypothetical protein